MISEQLKKECIEWMYGYGWSDIFDVYSKLNKTATQLTEDSFNTINERFENEIISKEQLEVCFNELKENTEWCV